MSYSQKLRLQFGRSTQLLNNCCSVVLLSIAMVLTGCATAPTASVEQDNKAKMFSISPNRSSIYIYRNESMGGAVKMDVELDGKPVGFTKAKTYFALDVSPGKHSIVSKAENDSVLEVNTMAGKISYVWQEVKMGVMYARNKLQDVDETTGKAGVAECKLLSTGFQDKSDVTDAVIKSSLNNSEMADNPEGDAYNKLEKLKDLSDKGAITQEEFNKKKKEILDKM